MRTSRSDHPPAVLRVVAVTGCDGSGKSTLASSLHARLRAETPTELIYLGQSSGHIAEWIAGLPLVGKVVARYLVGKAKRVHDRKTHAPGLATALALHLLSRWRAHKFRRMLGLCRRGVLVVTDRYPQAEVPGFHFDGTGFVMLDGASWLVRLLARREQRLYRWMADHVPALVIRLDVDVATAHARKPDHAPEVLQQKIAVLPRLTFNGAQILALDGRTPATEVLRTALDAVHATLAGTPA
jgi:thymidylate kinase